MKGMKLSWALIFKAGTVTTVIGILTLIVQITQCSNESGQNDNSENNSRYSMYRDSILDLDRMPHIGVQTIVGPTPQGTESDSITLNYELTLKNRNEYDGDSIDISVELRVLNPKIESNGYHIQKKVVGGYVRAMAEIPISSTLTVDSGYRYKFNEIKSFLKIETIVWRNNQRKASTIYLHSGCFERWGTIRQWPWDSNPPDLGVLDKKQEGCVFP